VDFNWRDHHPDPKEVQRKHGERVEARQAERAWDGSSSHARVLKTGAEAAAIEALLKNLGLTAGKRTLADRSEEQAKRKALQALDGLFFAALLDDLVSSGRPKALRHLGMEGIHSAIDAQPPFLKFWGKLNDHRAEQGLDELRYNEAKELFLGGKTPVGALTFIGKEWDGVRAIPGQNYDGLRAIPGQNYDGLRAYTGQFRETQSNGSVIWRPVHNSSGVVSYASPEAALEGAARAKRYAAGEPV
jgi:hypothetical protein